MMLQVGCRRARSLTHGHLRRRKELAHAFFSKLAILVVVKGLATELAKESWPVPANAHAVLTRAVNQALCAVACCHTKSKQTKKSTVKGIGL